MSGDWGADLEALVEDAVEEAGSARVAEALAALAARLQESPGSVRPLRPPVPVLGVVASGTGWVGVLLTPAGRGTVHVSSRIASLVEQVRQSVELGLIGYDSGAATPDLTADLEHWLRLGPGIAAVPASAAPGLARRDALARAGLTAPGWFAGSGFTEAELLAACAVACAVATGRAEDH